MREKPSSVPASSTPLELSFSGRTERLDTWLAQHIEDLSRSRVQELIKQGLITVNGAPRKPHAMLKPGDCVTVIIPPPTPATPQAQDIPLDIIYEDREILVINKPPGLVTHPAPGHEDGTLVNAVLHHCHDLGGIGGELRPGIVHRLDKDTSGVLVVAKNETAQKALVDQFKDREIHKEYLALVWGALKKRQGTIESLIGRSTHDRKKMSARPARGRPAITHYEVLHQLEHLAQVRVHIETGRTHQIRVHMAFIGHPVVGDRQYGRAPAGAPQLQVERQMLHAHRLTLQHPRTSKSLTFIAPEPADMKQLLLDKKEG